MLEKFGKPDLLMKVVMLTMAALLSLPAVSVAETSYFLPCGIRYEVDHDANVRSDYARLGSFNNTWWRTWAEFDLSILEGLTVTGVGFRVFNDWSGSRIDVLLYGKYRPSDFT